MADHQVSSELFNLLNQLHVWPFLVAAIIIGMFASASMMLVSAFKLLGETFEAYYEFRVRCLQYQRRYQACRDKDGESDAK